jgi:hypothetical protein
MSLFTRFNDEVYATKRAPDNASTISDGWRSVRWTSSRLQSGKYEAEHQYHTEVPNFCSKNLCRPTGMADQ